MSSLKKKFCVASRPPDYESRLRFLKKKKKRERVWRCDWVGSLGGGDPWRQVQSRERGGGKSPAREANGSRRSPRADGAAERRSALAKASSAVVPVSPVVPLPRPPSTQAAYEVGRGGDEERPTQEDARGASPDARAEGQYPAFPIDRRRARETMSGSNYGCSTARARSGRRCSTRWTLRVGGKAHGDRPTQSRAVRQGSGEVPRQQPGEGAAQGRLAHVQVSMAISAGENEGVRLGGRRF